MQIKIAQTIMRKIRSLRFSKKSLPQLAIGFAVKTTCERKHLVCFLCFTRISISWLSYDYRKKQAYRKMPQVIESICLNIQKQYPLVSLHNISLQLYDITLNGQSCYKYNILKYLQQTKIFPLSHQPRLLKLWLVALSGWYVYDEKSKTFRFFSIKEVNNLYRQQTVDKEIKGVW